MTEIVNLPGKAFRQLRTVLRILWIRVSAMGLLAVVALYGSHLIGVFLPDNWLGLIQGRSADRLLNLIATAMLTVTTFSLTVMVSVYRSSSSQFTPRIHQLIRTDSVTQNTLATFTGAYVYALVAIVLREVGYFGDEQALVLFIVTVLVLALIVWSMVRWMQHLQTLGSLINSARRLETITANRFRERLDTPCLGATPLTGEVPEDGLTVVAKRSGYVQHIHPEPLQEDCAEAGVEMYLLQEVGDYVFVGEPVARITGGTLDDDARETLKQSIHDNVVTGDERTYDQDPRFGLQVMSEIGSKALSPGINDPGTAIDALNRLGRVLSDYRDETQEEGERPHAALHIRPLDARTLVDDSFAGIARDGASVIEVQVRLQRVLAGLMRHPDRGLSAAAREHAALFYDRAVAAMDFAPDRDKLRAATHPDVLAERSDDS